MAEFCAHTPQSVRRDHIHCNEDLRCGLCVELLSLRAFRDEVQRTYMESIGLKTLERGIRAALDRLAAEGSDK